MFSLRLCTATAAFVCALGWLTPGAGWTAPGGGPAFVASDRAASDSSAPDQSTKPPAPKAPQTAKPGAKVQPQKPQAPPVLTPAPGNPVAVISTTLGDVTIELFKDRAPVSVDNFVQYVNDGFYAGTLFHRVVPNFMIQGGGYTKNMEEKPTRDPIQNEATNGLRNTRGTVAMARKASLRSATAQFYINVVDNRMLDHSGFSPADFGYAVFGRVLSGMEVVDKIAAVPTTFAGGMENVPVEPVVITGVRIKR